MRLLLVTDQKPGHVSQLRGLSDAVARSRRRVTSQWVRANESIDAAADLVVAAGRRTQWPALRFGRQTGAPVVVLMKPTLPRRLFDLCLVPEHDGVTGPNVVTTVGALNDVRPPGLPEEASDKGERAGGLLLIGGPSRHHGWDDAAVFAQIERVIGSGGPWTMTTSRRTPEGASERLGRRFGMRVEFVPCEQTPAGWVRTRLAGCERAVVSEDSVSMLSEAATAGCRTGVLELPRLRPSRVSRMSDGLIAAGHACRLRDLESFTDPVPLAEADRVARVVVRRLKLGRPVKRRTRSRVAA